MTISLFPSPSKRARGCAYPSTASEETFTLPEVKKVLDKCIAALGAPKHSYEEGSSSKLKRRATCESHFSAVTTAAKRARLQSSTPYPSPVNEAPEDEEVAELESSLGILSVGGSRSEPRDGARSAISETLSTPSPAAENQTSHGNVFAPIV